MSIANAQDRISRYPVVRHSYSALTTFETCPRQYEGTYITKELKFIPNPATKHGTDVHKAIEDMFNLGTPLPAEFEIYRPLIDKVRRLTKSATSVLVEKKLAVDVNKQPTDFDAEDVWVRGIADLIVLKGTTAIAIDWKTGKMRDSLDQLILMGLFIFEHYPHINTVFAALAWLKVGQTTRLTMHRHGMASLWLQWEDRYLRLAKAVKAGEFIPTPNGLCNGWCGLTSCEHWRERK